MAARFVAPEAEKRNWSIRAQEARVGQAIHYVADMLGIGPFLAGANFSLADISVSTALGMWRGALGQALPDKLVSYQERMEARPALRRAQERNS